MYSGELLCCIETIILYIVAFIRHGNNIQVALTYIIAKFYSQNTLMITELCLVIWKALVPMVSTTVHV